MRRHKQHHTRRRKHSSGRSHHSRRRVSGTGTNGVMKGLEGYAATTLGLAIIKGFLPVLDPLYVGGGETVIGLLMALKSKNPRLKGAGIKLTEDGIRQLLVKFGVIKGVGWLPYQKGVGRNGPRELPVLNGPRPKRSVGQPNWQAVVAGAMM